MNRRMREWSMWKKTSAQMLPFVSLCNVADFCYNLMTNPCSEYLSTTCPGDNKRHSKLAHWWCYLMNPLKELHWLVISTMPPASNIYIISKKKNVCNMFHSVHIEYCLSSSIHRLSSEVCTQLCLLNIWSQSHQQKQQRIFLGEGAAGCSWVLLCWLKRF